MKKYLLLDGKVDVGDIMMITTRSWAHATWLRYFA